MDRTTDNLSTSNPSPALKFPDPNFLSNSIKPISSSVFAYVSEIDNKRSETVGYFERLER